MDDCWRLAGPAGLDGETTARKSAHDDEEENKKNTLSISRISLNKRDISASKKWGSGWDRSRVNLSTNLVY